MIRASLITSVALATPAWAELRPAPEYFLDVIVATSTAQELARACPTVSIDPVVVGNASGAVLSQLEEDGFDVLADDLGMEDTGPGIQQRQDAFVAKHGLADRADAETVCAAARLEMAEGTQIGTYLVEVTQ